MLKSLRTKLQLAWLHELTRPAKENFRTKLWTAGQVIAWAAYVLTPFIPGHQNTLGSLVVDTCQVYVAHTLLSLLKERMVDKQNLLEAMNLLDRSNPALHFMADLRDLGGLAEADLEVYGLYRLAWENYASSGYCQLLNPLNLSAKAFWGEDGPDEPIEQPEQTKTLGEVLKEAWELPVGTPTNSPEEFHQAFPGAKRVAGCL